MAIYHEPNGHSGPVYWHRSSVLNHMWTTVRGENTDKSSQDTRGIRTYREAVPDCRLCTLRATGKCKVVFHSVQIVM